MYIPTISHSRSNFPKKKRGVGGMKMGPRQIQALNVRFTDITFKSRDSALRGTVHYSIVHKCTGHCSTCNISFRQNIPLQQARSTCSSRWTCCSRRHSKWGKFFSFFPWQGRNKMAKQFWKCIGCLYIWRHTVHYITNWFCTNVL